MWWLLSLGKKSLLPTYLLLVVSSGDYCRYFANKLIGTITRTYELILSPICNLIKLKGCCVWQIHQIVEHEAANIKLKKQNNYIYVSQLLKSTMIKGVYLSIGFVKFGLLQYFFLVLFCVCTSHCTPIVFDKLLYISIDMMGSRLSALTSATNQKATATCWSRFWRFKIWR